MIDLTDEKLDFKKYEEYIGAYGNANFLDADKFNKEVSMSAAKQITCRIHMENQLKFLQGGFNTEGTSLQKVAPLFIQQGIPESFFKAKKKRNKTSNSSGITFAEDVQIAVMDYLLNSDYDRTGFINILNYMDLLMEKKNYDSVLKSIRYGRERGQIDDSEAKGRNSSDLLEMYNIYVRQITGRYYAREMPIVQLPKPIRECITVPNNYVMLAFDLHQIDLRVGYNMYLRGFYPEEDKIFDSELEDKYKALYKIICRRIMLEEDLDFFAENRSGIKTNILSAMYGATLPTLQSNLNSQEFNTALKAYFEGHELHKKIVAKIKRLYDFGVPFTVKDFFGFEIDIELSSSGKTYRKQSFEEDTVKDTDIVEEKDENDVQLPFEKIVDLVFSRTIQSTSNSIIVKWTNYVLDSLREEGLDDSTIWVNMIRHDEVVFTVYLQDLDKLDTLFNSLRVRISDWDIISFDTEVFIHYGVSEGSEELEQIKSKITELYPESKFKELPLGEHVRNTCIPSVHTIYAFSPYQPSQLYQELFNTTLDISDEEGADRIELAYKQGLLGSEFENYREFYDMFIIQNSNTGNERLFTGIHSLSQVVNEYRLEYIQVQSVTGDGILKLGDCFGKYSSLLKTTALQELEAARAGKIKRGS